MFARSNYKKRKAFGSSTRQLDDNVTNAVNYMVGLLAKREYSAKELLEKALNRYTAQASNEALDICIERGYQSDERYAQMLVRHIEFANYGPMKLQFEAKRKGIDLSLINDCSQEVDWLELSYEALTKKFGVTKLDFEQGRKALAYLARRGFSSSTCMSALERLRQEAQDLEKA